MKNINLVTYLCCLFVFGGLVWFPPHTQILQHLLQQGWHHSKAMGLSNCSETFPFSNTTWQEHTCNRSGNTRACKRAKLSWKEEHIPWHLAHAAMDCSCAWHVEMRRETKAVAHKVVISPPRLLLPHVGFHSISIASQQLHTQHLFSYI